MSLIVKILLPLAVAAVAIWGYLTYARPEPVPEATLPPMHQETPTPIAQDDASAISARSTSDADLDADLSSIDAQLKAATESSAAVDAGLSDTAGDTSY